MPLYRLQRSSKWILALLLLITVHYVMVTYFTIFKPTSTSSTVERKEMAKPVKVMFPVNKQYHPGVEQPLTAGQPGGVQAPRANIRPPKNELAPKPPKEMVVPKDTVKIEKTKVTASKASAKLTEKNAEVNPVPLFDNAVVVKPVPLFDNAVVVKSASKDHLRSNLTVAKVMVKPAPKAVVTKPAAVKSGEPKLILAWTPLTQQKPLWGIKSWTFRHCAYSQCTITGNRSLLDSADLLLFRIRELKMDMKAQAYRPYVRPIDTSDLPAYHRPQQMWMDINQESPIFTHADEEVAALNNMFNLSSNYLLNSDFTLSYIPIVKPKPSVSQSKSVDYSVGKTKMALWFVSHCHAGSGRDEYVKELQKHNISVDIIGRCSGKSDGCAAGNKTCYLEVRKKYKFYLAFENSICTEYITEKFWNTLTSDSYNIPIALGASIKEYERFAPPNSFLHTRNFTSVKLLAEFMHRLDKDREAYNSYHRWRESHEISPRNHPESLHCYMCRQAHEKKDGKSEYKHISKYWSRNFNCDVNPEPIK